MKKLIPIFIAISLGSVASYAQADDLLQVYQQAKLSNPDLRKAIADRDAAYANVGVSRSDLLPQLNISGSYNITHGRRDINHQNSKSAQAGVTLSQTLFRFDQWKKLDISKKSASIKEIAYQAAEQNLRLNTSVAYFNVLRAVDTLSFITAKKDYIYKQLEQTKARYKVGLLPITDMQNAQAQYDQTLADEVNARNSLDNAIENLRQVSGQYYSKLSALDTEKFKTELPGSIKQLQSLAESNNLDLLTAKLAVEVSRDQIKLASSGYMPVLTVQASSGLSRGENYGDGWDETRSMGAERSYTGQNQIGLNLSIPLFSGGQTYYSVKSAQYGFTSSSEDLEKTNRLVIMSLRSYYNNISASVSAIKAYHQAVISAQSSLDATLAGYKVGTRTIVDVLNATTTLYNAKQQLSNAKYDYLINLLQLKSVTGQLSDNDIMMLNTDLGQPVDLPMTN